MIEEKASGIFPEAFFLSGGELFRARETEFPPVFCFEVL